MESGVWSLKTKEKLKNNLIMKNEKLIFTYNKLSPTLTLNTRSKRWM